MNVFYILEVAMKKGELEKIEKTIIE